MLIGGNMRVLQALRFVPELGAAGIDDSDIIGWSKVVDKLIVINDESLADPEIPLLATFNLGQKFFQTWLDNGYPCITMNRPHIGGWHNQYKARARRFSVNGYACTKIGQRTHDRYPLLGIARNPWKVKKIRNVLIAPPHKLTWFWNRETADDWVQKIEKHFAGTKARIRHRMKNQQGSKKILRYQTLWQDLDWADLVISYGSAICSEAFWYGKKVVNFAPCSTWTCCDRNLDNWDDPREPSGRDLWHEHAAWTQFTHQEIIEGRGPEMIIQYQGWPVALG